MPCCCAASHLNEENKLTNMEAALREGKTQAVLADIFTKPLGVMQHNYLKGRLTGFR